MFYHIICATVVRVGVDIVHCLNVYALKKRPCGNGAGRLLKIQAKCKRGRPKGSKNKETLEREALMAKILFLNPDPSCLNKWTLNFDSVKFERFPWRLEQNICASFKRRVYSLEKKSR